MSDDLPSTPEGRLIRRARERAIPKLTIRAAAARVGMSAEQWGYAERGYIPSRGGQPPREFHPPAPTLARMASAMGVTPGELESEGERPDAAGHLREILRTPPEPPATERRLAPVPAPPVLPADPTDQQVAQFIIRQQDDELVLDLWRAWTFRPASQELASREQRLAWREQRLAMVRELSRDPAEVLAEIEAEDRGEGRGGGRHREHREQALTGT